MTLLILELTDEQARQLEEEAARLSLSIQELAVCCLLFPWHSEEDPGGLDFEAAADYVFQKNSELYSRLA